MKLNLENISLLLIISSAIGVGISYGNVYLFHIILVPFILLLIINNLKVNSNKIKQLRKLSYYTFFIVFALWYSISILWSPHKMASTYYLIYILMGLSIIIAFAYSVKNERIQHRIYKWLSVVFIIEIIISLLEGLTSFRYPISPYSNLISFFGRNIGYDNNISKTALSIIMHTPTGFHWNPNDLAVTMLIVLPFFLFYKKTIIKIIGVISIISVIFLTGSRGVIFALIIQAIFYFILFLNKKQLINHIVIFIFGSIVLYLSIGIIRNDFSARYIDLSSTLDAIRIYVSEDHENINKESSISIRQNLIKNGLKAFVATNGIGIGGGNSTFIQKKENAKYTGKITSMHNFWIEILVEGGILIFILFILWYILMMRKLYVVSKHTDSILLSYFAKAGSLSMIGFFIGAISMSSAIYFFPMWILFGFNLSTINIYNGIKNNTL